MTTLKQILNYFMALVLAIGMVACSDDDNSNATNNGTARLSVRLVDAPGDYDAVFIDVQDVVIKYNGDEDEASVGINAGVYDLLELTGGVSVLLVDDEVPAGTISQIRLILGENNSVVVDGETFPLNTPSAQQSGLKLQVNETLEEGILYEFILDFDVDASIVELGNGNYNLKPVIRATTVAESGAIAGIVLPTDIQAEVTAENGIDVISTYVSATGEFVLSGVPEGTYELTITADPALNYDPIVISDVSVEIGLVTNIGTVNFE